jgi:hypothetical protein
MSPSRWRRLALSVAPFSTFHTNWQKGYCTEMDSSPCLRRGWSLRLDPADWVMCCRQSAWLVYIYLCTAYLTNLLVVHCSTCQISGSYSPTPWALFPCRGVSLVFVVHKVASGQVLIRVLGHSALGISRPVSISIHVSSEGQCDHYSMQLHTATAPARHKNRRG